MSTLFEQVSALKDSARRNRKRKRYPEAVRDLDKAIEILKDAELSGGGSSDSTPWEAEVATQLSDCYGSKGGVYREIGDLEKAIDSYDAGYVYESNPTFKIVNSYNLVQRLVTRILLRPDVVHDPALAAAHRLPDGQTVVEALREADKKIRGQLNGPRRGDSWALADLAMINLLLNDEPAANTVWDTFDATNPSSHAYGTTAEVLRALAKRNVTTGPALERAAMRLEGR